MPKTCLIVEGLTDVKLLQRVLPTRIVDDLRFFAAQDLISPTSVARNIVVHEGSPVFVVRDADTLDPDVAEKASRDSLFLINHVGGDIPADVFAFLPELEVIFLEAPEALVVALDRELNKIEVQRGLASPRRTIQPLLGPSGLNTDIDIFIARIDKRAAEDLRRGKQLSELIKRLRRCTPSNARSQQPSR